MSTRRVGVYSLQAAIAAEHARAPTAAATDWRQITVLYDVLLTIHPSPIVELNRAVAVAMRDGPDAALALMDSLLTADELSNYHLAHAAKADLLRRAGRTAEAAAAYELALSLARQEPEIRFLRRRLLELQATPG
jgi:RNA polymerase sigma-70 factor (ECF subfamily)